MSDYSQQILTGKKQFWGITFEDSDKPMWWDKNGSFVPEDGGYPLSLLMIEVREMFFPNVALPAERLRRALIGQFN